MVPAVRLCRLQRPGGDHFSHWIGASDCASLRCCASPTQIVDIARLLGCLCSAGDEDEWEAEASRAEQLKEPSEAVWAAFWGWDCCGPGGILDRLYTALKIPDRSWSGAALHSHFNL